MSDGKRSSKRRSHRLPPDEWPLAEECPNIVTFEEILGSTNGVATGDDDGEASGEIDCVDRVE